MGNLRRYSIIGLVGIVALGVVGIVAAATEQWALALAFTYGGLVVTVLLVLLSARYLARRARTDDKKARLRLQELRKLIEAVSREEEAFQTEQRQADQRLRKAMADKERSSQAAMAALQDSSQAAMAALQDNVQELHQENVALREELQKTSRSTSRHVTTTVRDSTRQIESLAQIYSRFSATKLPMPSTGGFAIDAQALAHLISLAEERKPRRILELGSGTSTIWLGYLCREFGGSLVTLDHLEKYLAATQTAVDRHNLNHQVEGRLAPLQKINCDGTSFNWYALEALNDLSDIDMLVVDGPPAATGPQARYPSLPMLIDRLATNATVVLDDAHRRDELKIVEEWEASFPEFTRIENGTSRLAVLERKA